VTSPAANATGRSEASVNAAAPDTSVVIICYNHALYLPEAIESVLAQSLKGVEVLVVDDGSTDDTAEVASRYPAVRYVRQRNQGMAAARNTGLRASRGRYVCFLDADDRLLPDALRAGVDSLEAHSGCAFVSGHYRLIAADGRPLPSEAVSCVEADHYRVLLERNYIGMHATVLFRREALESVAGFDRRLRACDDYDIYLRIASRMPVHCHDQFVAEYRQHGANTSRNWRLMLRSTVGPHRRQWQAVRGRSDLETSWRSGRRNWQAEYGDRLVAEVARDIRVPRRWGAAALGLATLLRHYPSGLWNRLRRRSRTAGAPTTTARG
jgi:glycosyltransferase involved in cell wall biosynthesis